MRRNVKTRLALALCLVVLSPMSLWAQSTTGRISGTVVDSSGAVLPGATVTVTHDATGLTRTATTDREGAYVLVSLPVGTYTVAAEMSGFRKAVRAGNVLVADGRITANFTLPVGEMSEVVEVRVPGETVNTVSGEIARTVDREQVQNLALNGRQYLQLATLIPGAPLLNDNALDIMTGLSINTSVNGSRGNATLLTVDGGFNMDSGSNNSQISNVSIDFIEEVSIKTANFSAEYGRNSGANINVVTRSGSNAFNGSVYEYHRNEGLDANDFFNNARGVKRSELSYNDFGWTAGGPIQKNRLFFFVGQEWKLIRRQALQPLRTIPTRAMRAGDFSASPTVLRDPRTGQPFPGNRIPADRITADGRAVAALFNAMEQQATSYNDGLRANNVLFAGENPFDWRQDVVRLDYQPTDSHRLTLRVLRDSYDLDAPFGTFIDSQVPTIPTNRRRPGRNYQVSHTWTATPSLVNEFKVNASWNGQRIPPIGDAWKRETYGFQYPQLFSGGGRFDDSIPDMRFTGYANVDGAARSLLSPTTDIQFSDNVTWLRGSHTLKTGGLVVRNRKDQNGRTRYAGFLEFAPAGNPNSTGDAFADALLGNFRRYSEWAYDPVGFFRFWQAEAFLSDNWRLSRSFSIEAGVRYTWHMPMYTQANNMASFDPARYDPATAIRVNRNGTLVPGSGNRYNGMVRAGAGVPDDEAFRVPSANDPAVLGVPAGAPRGFYPSRHLLAPRLSFAWTPTGSADLAVRGGAGLFYDRPEGNLLFGGGGNGPVNSPPYVVGSQYENGNIATPGGGAVPALAPHGEIASIDPDLQVPRSWNWSVSVQRALPWGMFGEIGYVGSRGQQLLWQPDINAPAFADLAANAALPAAQRANTNFLRPYKGYSQIRMVKSEAESRYHGLQLFLSRRQGAFRWTASYTLSRSYDHGNNNSANPEDYPNLSYNWGRSDFDRTHIFVGTWTWQLPIFREQRGIGRVLGGWEVSGIGRFQSGAPLTITFDSSIGNRRADFLGGEPYLPESERYAGAAGVVRYLNPAAFGPAPEGRRGNSTRNQFRGPSLTVFDISLRKGFAVRGDVRFQLQADLFNVLNQTNLRFNNQLLNFSGGGFGQLNQAAPPRQIQLGVRLSF